MNQDIKFCFFNSDTIYIQANTYCISISMNGCHYSNKIQVNICIL